MRQDDGSAVPIPACPATIDRTLRFLAQRWAVKLDLGRYRTILGRRASAIIERRIAGDARGADVLGWVTLAAVLAGCPNSLVDRLLRHPEIETVLADTISSTRDIMGPIATIDGPVFDVTVEGLIVLDIGSRAGWALVRLVGEAAGGGLVVFKGFPVSSASVLSAIETRITTAGRETP